MDRAEVVCLWAKPRMNGTVARPEEVVLRVPDSVYQRSTTGRMSMGMYSNSSAEAVWSRNLVHPPIGHLWPGDPESQCLGCLRGRVTGLASAGPGAAFRVGTPTGAACAPA